MKFTKMHGLGNDYIYMNCFDEGIENPGDLAVRLSDRHKGIGSDGLVLIMPSAGCDFRMRMFNADGTEAQMCGNASRCVAKYVYDNGMTDHTEITLETLAGTRQLRLFLEDGKVKTVRVDMGEPVMTASDIPVALPLDEIIDCPVFFPSETRRITCISMGNPHAVTFVDDVDRIPLKLWGPEMECYPLFPERINVEFVQRVSPEHLKMRVWERGAGETQACGTGACAALVAAVLTDETKRKATVSLPGGDLAIEWQTDDNHVYMTGEAVTVFTGEI
jgi:diaminopimelate epimerase